MASDLFREHPEVESGFECGVLLCNNPSEFLTFTPFRNHMAVGWGINEEDLTYACQAVNFDGFYERLFERSSIIQDKKPKFVFDKTPRYVTQLAAVQSRLDLPAIVLIKDPRSLALSDFKRSGTKIEEIDDWYERWKNPKRLYMRSAYQGYQYAWGARDARLFASKISASTQKRLLNQCSNSFNLNSATSISISAARDLGIHQALRSVSTPACNS